MYGNHVVVSARWMVAVCKSHILCLSLKQQLSPRVGGCWCRRTSVISHNEHIENLQDTKSIAILSYAVRVTGETQQTFPRTELAYGRVEGTCIMSRSELPSLLQVE